MVCVGKKDCYMLVYIPDKPDKSAHDFSIREHDDINNHLVQIEQDRHGGSHSGFPYTAWRGIRPDAISDRGPPCAEFWETWRDKLIFGGGNTPQEAFLDLAKKIDGVGIYLTDDEDPGNAPLLVIMFHGISERDFGMAYDSEQFREWIKQ